ncbi:aminotransferase class I/II-fold pyridoxal phosphate-dependent enzyme [Bradyrhizobium sp. USDA 4449]
MLRFHLSEGLGSRWPHLQSIAGQDGLFSMLPISAEQVSKLRSQHGIYIPAWGRINIAGISERNTSRVIEHILSI